ncbi:catechol 2,3-dioxygenase-like lactoylglutathione lyase family enzyme [Bacillus pakistanensis]|uniref:Catechol 2,3-dioxygenase-like lactoylglutathione lyase family enzyme n=1 Tax=Rossellomorea pakistanensis TaxID=992288 RepID=A0ABS2NJQ3_9BACI|nr:VOC family protein [Bacillus pakistanensis]MBM7588087.1 catechol 2,3-dioxygenase-like lactoylglutathione lyase family enzyme [Bacillus pakistanensis]
MSERLLRVGTSYIPVSDVVKSVKWYSNQLGAIPSYLDESGKMAIINMANQSFFLVKAKEGQCANFIDCDGNSRFSMSFEVDGEKELMDLHQELADKGVKVGEIEDRGHPGRNFVFYDPDDNAFDVWSELSPAFKERFADIVQG